MAKKFETVIDYTGADGETTRRLVRISSVVSRDKKTFLNGYCLDQQAPRQFRLDRIDCFITDEGECIPPKEFLPRLEYLRKEPPKVPVHPKKESVEDMVARDMEAFISSEQPRRERKPKKQKRPWTWRRVVNTIFGTYTVLLVLFCFAANSLEELAIVFTGLMAPALMLWAIGRWLTKPRLTNR